MNTILHIQSQSPPLPTSSSSIFPSATHLSFGSMQPMSTTWSGLGLSNPPPPLPNSASPSHFHSQQMSTPPLYSTLVSTSNQQHIPLTSPISSSSPPLSSTADHGYYSPPPISFPLPNHTFHPHYDHSSYRPPRVDLPRFNGEDVVGWLAMAEFRFMNELPR
jgi:hypothetical protein